MATSRSLALMAGIVGAIAGGLAGGIAGKKATQITVGFLFSFLSLISVFLLLFNISCFHYVRFSSDFFFLLLIQHLWFFIWFFFCSLLHLKWWIASWDCIRLCGFAFFFFFSSLVRSSLACGKQHDVGGTIQKVEKPASDPVETTASKVKKEQVETTGAAENKDDPYYKYLLAFVDD